jgi:tetratricopeptide (TPR) repeat protein
MFGSVLLFSVSGCMIKRSRQTDRKARCRADQKGTKHAQKFARLDAELVHQVQELLATWRGVVEARNPKSHFLTSDRKSHWHRAVSPSATMKQRTWWKHIDQVLQFFQDEWNSGLQADEEPLDLTRELFLRGPPGGAMQPIASADLQDLPSLGSKTIVHLHGYLDDLRARVEKSQLLENIVAERALRDSIASTLENLGYWSVCADELEHIVRINHEVQDFTEVARCLLRQGIALYRGEQFARARNVFERALTVLKNELPKRSDLKTELRVRDYLGLCYLRLKKPETALAILQESAAIATKSGIAIPLSDASRLMRTGIALLEMGKHSTAKGHFLEALAIRVHYKATAEAARTLRYIGSLYFEQSLLRHALCLWELCLKLQRALGDPREQAKIHFFRGRLFIRLSGEASEGECVECQLSTELFRDKTELKLLSHFASMFRDYPRRFYKSDYLQLARFSFGRTIEIGKTHALNTWVLEALIASSHLARLDRKTVT